MAEKSGKMNSSTPQNQALKICAQVKVPKARRRQEWYIGVMSTTNTLLVIVILLLLFGGGGFYWGGPVIGSTSFGVVLLICLAVYLLGGFRGPEKKV